MYQKKYEYYSNKLLQIGGFRCSICLRVGNEINDENPQNRIVKINPCRHIFCENCETKNKTLPELYENPKFVRFHMNSLKKILEILTKNNYNVVVIVNDKIKNNIIIRKIHGVCMKSNRVEKKFKKIFNDNMFFPDYENIMKI